MGELVEVVAGGAWWGLAAGLVIGDRVGEWTAETREQVHDVVAGATAEHAPAPTATGAVRQPTA